MKIIAYGSLMNKDSLKKTLKRDVLLCKIVITGYRRVFNAPFSSYAFLNLEKCETRNTEMAYFTINKQELKLFWERERGSKLVEIKQGYYAFVWPRESCVELSVLQSYIDICLGGARELDVNFWKNTVRPKVIVNDRKNPGYS